MEFIILIILALVIFATPIKVLKEYERLVVLRRGSFFKVRGPGIALLIPLVDKGVKVNLQEEIPGWHTFSQTELEEWIKRHVLYESRANPR
jgi:regulator of protease activity HflC (stomatin/prohibitin superfamily)